MLADLRMKDDCEPNSIGLPVQDIIEEHFGHVDGPVVTQMPCGHTQHQLTLPMGAQVELSVSADRVTLDFAGLWK
jgi:muramoyltetrapeptide carboxypeptidase LdcA involved in peptidoglycan recycling